MLPAAQPPAIAATKTTGTTATPAAPATARSAARGAATGAAAGPGTPAAAQVLAAVRAEWPRYDLRRTGRLSPLEFSTWVMHANGVAVAPAGRAPAAGAKAGGVTAVAAMNATARAFAVADTDHDGGVTPEEMAAFLRR